MLETETRQIGWAVCSKNVGVIDEPEGGTSFDGSTAWNPQTVLEKVADSGM